MSSYSLFSYELHIFGAKVQKKFGTAKPFPFFFQNLRQNGVQKGEKSQKVWRIEIKRLSLHSERILETSSPSSEISLEANGRFISSILLRRLFFSIRLIKVGYHSYGIIKNGFVFFCQSTPPSLLGNPSGEFHPSTEFPFIHTLYSIKEFVFLV